MEENDRAARFNASGYYDPTAYRAMRKISKAEAERDRLVGEYIHIIKALASGMGLEVLNGIVVKDTTTGKEYR